jgi:hypothetical protein
VVVRVRPFLDELPPKHAGERIVVIGHSATKWAGSPPPRHRPGRPRQRSVRLAGRLDLHRPDMNHPLARLPTHVIAAADVSVDLFASSSGYGPTDHP